MEYKLTVQYYGTSEVVEVATANTREAAIEERKRLIAKYGMKREVGFWANRATGHELHTNF